MQKHRLKLTAASLGAGALLAMGAVGATVGVSSAETPTPAPPGPVTPAEPTLGGTSKAPPTSPVVASPGDKAPPAQNPAPGD